MAVYIIVKLHQSLHILFHAFILTFQKTILLSATLISHKYQDHTRKNRTCFFPYALLLHGHDCHQHDRQVDCSFSKIQGQNHSVRHSPFIDQISPYHKRPHFDQRHRYQIKILSVNNYKNTCNNKRSHCNSVSIPHTVFQHHLLIGFQDFPNFRKSVFCFGICCYFFCTFRIEISI